MFALIPIYTRELSTAEYGLYDLSVTVITLVAAFIYCDIWVAALRQMYQRRTRGEKCITALAGVVIFAFSSVLLIGFGYVACLVFDLSHWELVVGLGIANSAKELAGYIARGFDANRLFVISGVLNSIAVFALNLLFLIYLDLGVRSLYVASIGGSVLQVGLVLLGLRSHLMLGSAVRSVIPELRALLSFSWPLGINAVGYWLVMGLGKIFVTDQLGIEANGLYGIGTRIATVVTVLFGVLVSVWQDIVFSRDAAVNDEGSGESGLSQGIDALDRASELIRPRVNFASTISHYIVICAIVTAFVLAVLRPLFPFAVGSSFVSIYSLLPGYVFVAAFAGFNSVVGNVFYSVGRAVPVTTTTVLAAGILVFLIVPAIREFGLAGANAATGLVMLVAIVCRLVWLRAFAIFRIAFFDLVVAIALMAVGLLVYYASGLWMIVVGAFALPLVALIWLVAVYRKA